MFKFVLIKIFIFDKPFGISISISLNSFINGGNTRIKIVNTITDIKVKTKNKDSNRGIFKPFCISLHKLLPFIFNPLSYNPMYIKQMEDRINRKKKNDIDLDRLNQQIKTINKVRKF